MTLNPAEPSVPTTGQPLDSLPAVVDSDRFCLDSSSVSGEVGTDRLPRLFESLAGPVGRTRWAFRGWRKRESDGSTTDWLSLKAGLSAHLHCARCDEPAPFEVEIEREFLLAKDEALAMRLDEDAEEFDVLASSRKFLLAELLEDECLMALPTFVVHLDCQPMQAEPDTIERVSPFAALDALRRPAEG